MIAFVSMILTTIHYSSQIPFCQTREAHAICLQIAFGGEREREKEEVWGCEGVELPSSSSPLFCAPISSQVEFLRYMCMCMCYSRVCDLRTFQASPLLLTLLPLLSAFAKHKRKQAINLRTRSVSNSIKMNASRNRGLSY